MSNEKTYPKPTVPGRTPEQQALCDQFHRDIGQALADNWIYPLARDFKRQLRSS